MTSLSSRTALLTNQIQGFLEGESRQVFELSKEYSNRIFEHQLKCNEIERSCFCYYCTNWHKNSDQSLKSIKNYILAEHWCRKVSQVLSYNKK